MLRDLALTYAWNALWQVPLFCAAGWMMGLLLRESGPVLRHRVSVAMLLLPAVVPSLSWHRLHLPAAFLRWPWSEGKRGSGAVTMSLSALQKGSHGLSPLPHAWVSLFVAAYLAVFVLAMLRFGQGLWKLHRLAKNSRPVHLDKVRKAAFKHLLRSFHLGDVRLRESDEVSGPTAFWMGAPVLLLPSRFAEEAALDDLLAALAHECAHLGRRDFALQLFYTACTLPIAMHPLSALLRDRVAESREVLCDALAAQSLFGGERYAAALLRIAALLPTLHPAANLHAIGMLDAHSFERRIMIMLHPQRSHSRIGRFGSVLVAGVLGVVTCTSALALHTRVGGGSGAAHAGQAVLTRPDVVYRRDPVYPAEARAQKNTLDGTVTLAVDVNAEGKPTSVRIAKSLRPDYDQSAVDAVTEWRFNPATENGKPVAGSTSININYMLQ